jgi:hypothetical protein
MVLQKYHFCSTLKNSWLKVSLPALYECLKALILSKITLSSVLKLYQRNVATFHTSDTHFSLFSLSYSWLLQLPWRTSRRARSREKWITPHWLILSSQNSTVVSPLLPTADPRPRIVLHPSALHCNSWYGCFRFGLLTELYNSWSPVQIWQTTGVYQSMMLQS